MAVLASFKAEKLLVVDDEPDVCMLFAKKASAQGYLVDTADELQDAYRKMSHNSYRAVILDQFLGQENAIDAIGDFLKRSPTTDIVILTGHGSIDTAVKAMNRGARGFLVKTDPIDQNISKLVSWLSPRGDLAGDDALETEIIGESDDIKKIMAKCLKLRDIDSTVLIQGESGTGKEMVAREIHRLSRRSEQSFIGINCAAMSESILESELFGYKKGAFTDAKKDRKGYFEACSDGTLFLDEVGEMSPGLQSKILRVLQEKELTPLGSWKPIKINTRIIAATNRSLEDEVEAGRFRNDLFYRLAVFQINLPALRDRKEDIPRLVEHFIERYNQHFGKSVHVPSEGIYARLRAYDWPGNVRELQNAIERAVALSEEGAISAENLLPHRDRKGYSLHGGNSQKFSELPMNYHDAKMVFERYYIENLLGATKGNMTEAARISGQYRQNLYRLIKKFEIDPYYYKS